MPCVLDIQETSFTKQATYEDTPLIYPPNETIKVGSFHVEMIQEAVAVHKQGPLYPKESNEEMTPGAHNDLF